MKKVILFFFLFTLFSPIYASLPRGTGKVIGGTAKMGYAAYEKSREGGCSYCNGTGWTGYFKCHKCDGTGKTPINWGLIIGIGAAIIVGGAVVGYKMGLLPPK